MKRSRLGPGKKTKEWASIRKELIGKFERAGVTTCELRLEGCFRDNFLGFAHSLKRRNANTPDLMREVILACNPCHDIIEGMGEEKMSNIVRSVISKRKFPIDK